MDCEGPFKDDAMCGGLVGRALDGMCVGLVTMGPAGRILWMNRSAQKTLGVDFEENEGKPLGSVVKDPQFGAFWAEAMASEDTVMGEVSLHWPRDAELKVNATTSLAPSGRLIGRAVLFCDVTAERTVQVQLSKEATERLLNVTGTWNETAEAKEALTAQELRIIKFVGQGLSNPQIADEMSVALSTVRSHLKHVYGKLDLKNRSEAISYALRNGLS